DQPVSLSWTSRTAPEYFARRARQKLRVFGSRSPDYLAVIHRLRPSLESEQSCRAPRVPVASSRDKSKVDGFATAIGLVTHRPPSQERTLSLPRHQRSRPERLSTPR